MNTYNWNLKFPKCNAVFPGRKRQRPYGKHISPFSASNGTAIPQSHIWRKVYDYLPDTAPLIKSGTTCKNVIIAAPMVTWSKFFDCWSGFSSTLRYAWGQWSVYFFLSGCRWTLLWILCCSVEPFGTRKYLILRSVL